MSFPPPLSSEPSIKLFPTELELRIFQACYFAYPETLPTLLLVCRHVFEWLNALRYYSMQLHLEEDVERVQRWIQTQSPQSIHQNVKAIVIYVPDASLFAGIQSIVSVCTGVESLGLWLATHPDAYSDHSSSLDNLTRAILTKLPNVRHLSLSSGDHIFRSIASGSDVNKGIEKTHIAFRDSLVSIDWGGMPDFPLDIIPNISYTMMRLDWTFKKGNMRRMVEWVSRPSSKGLILLVEDIENIDFYQVCNPDFDDGHILHHDKVVALSTPDDWVADWESFVFGDGQDVFTWGKKYIGIRRWEDRIVKRQNACTSNNA
ncbi:hypothetical protein DL96DRAFT_1677498 [Flagelloscypha sp. PMI_526]|nr:hypothetical protein DL96DRAFT_1677498 [Flagelloscypha sp. PMI_526]